MTDPAIIANLRDRRQTLLAKVAELDDARQLVLLTSRSGRISVEVANAQTAKIAAERSVVDAVLANTEGQKQTSDRERSMSAFPPAADFHQSDRQVRFVPDSDMS